MSSFTCSSKVSAPSIEDLPQTKKEATAEKNTYDQILKSSALIGGSSVLTIAIGIVRTKVMALLLGPAGIGLLGIYGSIIDVAHSISGMGINSSGVRQIAAAVGTGETKPIARTVVLLRRTAVILGILGAALLVAFSGQVSTLTFGSDNHATAVALLSIAVFFRLVSGAQGALIQGMRRISDLARMGVLGTLFGAVISIPVVYFLREKGIVLAHVGIAAMTLVASWWYSRKVQIQPTSMTMSQAWQETASLLKLGFAFMASGFLMMGAAYAVRAMIVQMVGFESAGFYQAAWAMGGLYVGFILQAMGADFYPRLTGVAEDNTQCNRLVNEQTQVSLLLAGPGVLVTLTFASFVIALFYSTEFSSAVGILRWICLGMTLRVVTWPIGFIILAKGERSLFFWTEMAWTVVNVGLSWLCLKYFDLNGVGIAFFGSYLFHGLMIYPIVRRLSGFRWSAANRKTGLIFLSLIAVIFSGFFLLPSPWAIGAGVLAVIFSGIYSIRVILNLIYFDRLPRPIQRLLLYFGSARVYKERQSSKGNSADN